MMKYVSAAAMAAMFVAGPAFAQAVTQTSDQLANINGSAGGATATTTTDSTGRRTTVTSPAGVRYSNPSAPKDVWQQQNVGTGGTVGITSDYARNGNGSAFFSGTSGGSKADLEIYFSNTVALASVTSLSYDTIRDAASTSAAHLINSVRMMIGDAAGNFTNTYLIFEPVYNGFPVASPVAENNWYTFTVNDSTRLWANNGNLSEPAGSGNCPGCYATFGEWKAANAGATLYGLSTGTGSGFDNFYQGAVDNVTLVAGANTRSWNFEVAAPVPEPATWAMMIGGFGLVGGAMRRTRTRLRYA